VYGADGFGADESINIINEFGGQMDPQLFGKCIRHCASFTISK